MDVDIQLLVNQVPVPTCRCTLATPGIIHITGRQILDALGRPFLSEADMVSARIDAPAKRAVPSGVTATPL